MKPLDSVAADMVAIVLSAVLFDVTVYSLDPPAHFSARLPAQGILYLVP